ncbi:hypothetical protein Natpe_3261 [Natrinema pellirubrum DSM 15624]|uniref:Uncharacterized protein n=1 Tax=Natrinema pellirubrum (strain DSM 15624 / CIP 106293 / JCM 10476 / NCIMB 786 / 157) TaxID=797303 RepID=L0JRP0_NATP1|nr:hypothetical protein Natpe_3261 [Natrinema pellirubrum DSM 15624]
MVSRLTIHCDCGTDSRIEPTDGPVICPGCETTFATMIFEHPTDHHAPSARHGTHAYRGP